MKWNRDAVIKRDDDIEGDDIEGDGVEDDDDIEDEHDNDQYEKIRTEDEASYRLRSGPRISHKVRETLIICVLAGLIGGILWGVYKWTNASRYISEMFSGAATPDE